MIMPRAKAISMLPCSTQKIDVNAGTLLDWIYLRVILHNIPDNQWVEACRKAGDRDAGDDE